LFDVGGFPPPRSENYAPFSSRWPRYQKRLQSSRRRTSDSGGVLLVRDARFRKNARACQMAGVWLAPILPLAAGMRTTSIAPGFVFGPTRSTALQRHGEPGRAAASAVCSYHPAAAPARAHEPVCASAVVLWPHFCCCLPSDARAPGAACVNAIAVILIADWIAFSSGRSALLTRLSAALVPLVLLVAVAEWPAPCARLGEDRRASAVRPFSGCGLTRPSLRAGGHLTYRDMIVLHQRAVGADRPPMAAGDGADRGPATSVVFFWSGRTGLYPTPPSRPMRSRTSRASRWKTQRGWSRPRQAPASTTPPALFHQVGAAARPGQSLPP